MKIHHACSSQAGDMDWLDLNGLCSIVNIATALSLALQLVFILYKNRLVEIFKQLSNVADNDIDVNHLDKAVCIYNKLDREEWWIVELDFESM